MMIETKELTKTFPGPGGRRGNGQVEAVRQIDLRVEAGEVVGSWGQTARENQPRCGC